LGFARLFWGYYNAKWQIEWMLMKSLKEAKRQPKKKMEQPLKVWHFFNVINV
jgi:hypothetical protein